MITFLPIVFIMFLGAQENRLVETVRLVPISLLGNKRKKFFRHTLLSGGMYNYIKHAALEIHKCFHCFSTFFCIILPIMMFK